MSEADERMTRDVSSQEPDALLKDLEVPVDDESGIAGGRPNPVKDSHDRYG